MDLCPGCLPTYHARPHQQQIAMEDLHQAKWQEVDQDLLEGCHHHKVKQILPHEGVHLHKEELPHRPPKDKPSLPSADEEPPTLPGDIYLHNIRKKIKTICLITFKTAKRRAPVRGEVRAAYSMMRAEKKGGEEVEEENGERGAKRKVSEGSEGGCGRSQGKRRTREATPDKVVLMMIMMMISGKKRKMN